MEETIEKHYEEVIDNRPIAPIDTDWVDQKESQAARYLLYRPHNEPAPQRSGSPLNYQVILMPILDSFDRTRNPLNEILSLLTRTSVMKYNLEN